MGTVDEQLHTFLKTAASLKGFYFFTQWHLNSSGRRQGQHKTAWDTKSSPCSYACGVEAGPLFISAHQNELTNSSKTSSIIFMRLGTHLGTCHRGMLQGQFP